VDVHRYRCASAGTQRALDRLRRFEMAPNDNSVRHSVFHNGHERVPARIERVEPVAKPRNVWRPASPFGDDGARDRVERRLAVRAVSLGDLVEQFDALLARTAVDI